MLVLDYFMARSSSKIKSAPGYFADRTLLICLICAGVPEFRPSFTFLRYLVKSIGLVAIISCECKPALLNPAIQDLYFASWFKLNGSLTLLSFCPGFLLDAGCNLEHNPPHQLPFLLLACQQVKENKR